LLCKAKYRVEKSGETRAFPSGYQGRVSHATSAKVESKAKTISISNPDKVMYPRPDLPSAVIQYYVGVSRYLLPHLKGHPVTLKRYPDGVQGKFFYEKERAAFHSCVGEDLSRAAPQRPITPFATYWSKDLRDTRLAG